MIVKLPGISLQVCKFTKNELLHTCFLRISLDFKLLFIVLFLEIISWNGVSCFNGGFLFQMGRGALFLSDRGGGAPHGGGHRLSWEGSKKS